jgi:acyl-CoA thioesterase
VDEVTVEPEGGEKKLNQDAERKSNLNIHSSPFARLLALEVIEAESGRVVMRLPFSEQLLQTLGRVHGGAIFALADHASGWAAFSTLSAGEQCATLEMKINYIAAVRNEDCIAEARVIHKGVTSIVVEAEVRSSTGRLTAKSLATFMIWKSQS